MKIRFSIHYHTYWGQRVCVAGSPAALGGWAAGQVSDMVHTGDGNWVLEIEVAEAAVPEVVRAAIRMCKEAGAGEISCLSWQPEQNWAATGLKGVVEEEEANLVILDLQNETLFKPVPVPNGIALKEARIMSVFFDYDVFIDMPITKDSQETSSPGR